MKIIDVEQGSDIWKELRRNKITATDSGIILGLNPWVTPYQLFQRKLGLIEEQEVNDKMREGSLLEEEARKFYSEVYCGGYLKWKPIVAVKDHLMASLDGYEDSEILEIKCGKKSYEDAINGIIAEYYIAQMQHQMYVCDCQDVIYFCYRSPSEHKTMTVQRDDAFIEKMIEAEKKFYDCLMSFIAPELTDRDYIIRNDPEFYVLADQYKETKCKREYLEKQEAALRDRLLQLSGDRPTKGSGLTISKSVRKGNIEYSAIPELKSINLDQYRKKNSEFWVIRDSYNIL